MISQIFSFLLLTHVALSETATIFDLPDYKSQRPCAKECFNGGAGDDELYYLANAVNCDFEDTQNDCICRADLQVSADQYLSRCVYDGCDRATIDVNSALSIYDNYCTDLGYHRSPMSTPATTTGMQGSSPTVTVTAVVVVTVSSANRQMDSLRGVLLAPVVGSLCLWLWG